MNEFYQFRAESGGEPASAELIIFSQIGEWEDMGDVSARAFAKDLAQLPSSVRRLDIHINSPGGSVFEAQAIYSRLADHRSEKIVYVDGLAASAASIIAMVGHKIYIRANANMMIHLPSGLAMGNAEDMRHMATALDSITESMINVYAKRTTLARDEIRSMLAAETWMWPEMAVEKGFADEVRGVVKAAAIVGEKRVIVNGIEHDLSRFHNVPAFTATTKTNTMKPKSKPKAGAETPDAEKQKKTPPVETETETETPEERETETTTPEETETPPPPTTPPDETVPKKPAKQYEEGVAAERARVSALQELDRPATHAIIVAAIKDGKQPTEIMAACMDAMDKAAKQGARHSDASELNGIPPGDGAEGGTQSTFGAKLKKAVSNRRGRQVQVNGRN